MIGAMLKAYLTLLAGYVGWGLFPLYWSLLAHVPASEVTMHRVVWSLPVLLALVYLSARRRTEFSRLLGSIRQLQLLAITAVLITLNWGVYVWAVAHGQVLEASMGYFLTPLINITAGVLLFQEKLSPLKWLAIAFAAAGVLFYIVSLGVLPWVALTVAVSFSSYGILRKRFAIGPVVGLGIETMMITPFALAYILKLLLSGQALFLHSGWQTDTWLILGGLVTVVPLALFTTGTRLLPMTSVGILFFLTPSLQFVIGALVLDEPLNRDKLTAFVIIWTGLILYSVSLIRGSGKQLDRVSGA